MKLVYTFLGIFFLFSVSIRSQTDYLPSCKVPVTFYDFHADGSNPDFEPGLRVCDSVNCILGAGLHGDETGATLDSLTKRPILGPSPYFSHRIAKWFRPWQSGDFTVPLYSNTGVYLKDTTLSSDTAYKNVVIQDTLVFTSVPGSGSLYRYASASFTPLDGRGFGNEPSGQGHNTGFTMAFHWEVAAALAQILNFQSEDDLWVFVNGRKAVDLGGIHGLEAASVTLKDLPGVTLGQRCTLDVFYAQRHAGGAGIMITTDFTDIMPFKLELALRSHAIAAESIVVYRAVIANDTGGERHEYDSLIHWTLWPSATQSSLSAATGGIDTLFLRQAYTTYIVGASVTDISVAPPKVFSAFDTVYGGAVIIKSKSVETAKSWDRVGDFYNLRGQRMPVSATSRAEGIVLERIIDPDGRTSVKKHFPSSNPLLIKKQ